LKTLEYPNTYTYSATFLTTVGVIDKALEVYQSKKDKAINYVKVCFSDNKISVEYYLCDENKLYTKIPSGITYFNRNFKDEESEQFRGWKTKYNDKI
jgi:hypothetical protein